MVMPDYFVERDRRFPIDHPRGRPVCRIHGREMKPQLVDAPRFGQMQSIKAYSGGPRGRYERRQRIEFHCPVDSCHCVQVREQSDNWSRNRQHYMDKIER